MEERYQKGAMNQWIKTWKNGAKRLRTTTLASAKLGEQLWGAIAKSQILLLKDYRWNHRTF